MIKKVKSLSSKIVFYIATVTILSVLTILYISIQINKEAFYNTEMEKARLVLSTIEPLIALNMYLDINERTGQLIKQLMSNPDILAVKVFQKDNLIYERKSQSFRSNIDESFIVKSPVYEPNAKKVIGNLVLIYSNRNFIDLIDRYTTLLISVLFSFGIFFLLFSLYVKKLLSPLHKIAKILRVYSPDKNIEIPFANQDNEIGLISNALNKMQNRIAQYSKEQSDINKLLEKKVREKTHELSQQLYTNDLTKLPNRLSLLHNINKYDDGALLIINIDDFKEINDFFGQMAGDSVLISFSRMLSELIYFEDNIKLFHLSGDEFALFYTKKPSVDKFSEFAKLLSLEIEKKYFSFENNELNIRVSIGGAFQVQEALEKADIALKSAKKQGKDFILYNESFNIEQQYKNNIEWTKKLNWSIENDKILPYFQAIYDNKTNKLVSAECLIRLEDSNNNILTPFHFLDIAKKSKLYSKLTKIMIKKSCQYFQDKDCDFSINLSVEDILDEEIVEYILLNINRYKVSNKVVFELLETEGIENYEEVSSFIYKMKSIGCRIAIDDFGSGYSNFEYLLELKVDYIKIDGSLIKNLDKDSNAQVVVETIVDFAKKLKIIVIAEYVHSEAVHKKVQELNIDRSQGFFLSEPQVSLNL